MSRDATIDWKADLHSIEPELAWSRWEPSAEEPWNMQRAALLFRRAGFGASEEELKKALLLQHKLQVKMLQKKRLLWALNLQMYM